MWMCCMHMKTVLKFISPSISVLILCILWCVNVNHRKNVTPSHMYHDEIHRAEEGYSTECLFKLCSQSKGVRFVRKTFIYLAQVFLLVQGWKLLLLFVNVWQTLSTTMHNNAQLSSTTVPKTMVKILLCIELGFKTKW